jgi:Mg-chelatase subunit ChlD
MAFSGECSNPITNRHDFSLDASSLKRFVNNLRAGGGTPMSAAVEYANVYLANNKSSTSASEMILLLADGDDNCDILSPVVRELKSKGILFRHQTIGLELDRSSNAARDLKQLAKSSGGDYATASNAKQLSQTFENAAIAMGILSLIGSYDPKHGGGQSDSSQQSIWDGFSE